MEGSFYLKDRATGNVIRWRSAGTMNTLHIYLKDTDGREKGFFYINRDGFDLMDTRHIARINGREVRSIDKDGVVVRYMSEQGYKNYSEAQKTSLKKKRELDHLRRNPLVSLLRRKEAAVLEQEIEACGGCWPNIDTFYSEERVPVVKVNAIFQSMGDIFKHATHAIQNKDAEDVRAIEN